MPSPVAFVLLASAVRSGLFVHDGTVVTSEGRFTADVPVRDGIIVEAVRGALARRPRRVYI